METLSAEPSPIIQDDWLQSEYQRLDAARRRSCADMDDLHEIDPEADIQSLKQQISEKYEAEKRNALFTAILRSNGSLDYHEIKKEVITQIARCIWFYPDLPITGRLVYLVSVDALTEAEAEKLLLYQVRKTKDPDHKNLLIHSEKQFSDYVYQASECLTESWFKERRNQRAKLAAQSKLKLWASDIVDDWKEDWTQMKEVFEAWTISFVCVGTLVYVFISHSSGMPDLSGLFLMAGTVIWVMYHAREKRKALLHKIEVATPIKKRILIDQATSEFPIGKAILILLLFAFIIYFIRGCPEPIPYSLDPQDYEGPR